MVQLSNYPPENQVHHIVKYIENGKNGINRFINFNRFIYREVYAD